jgi:hypothetical protein
MIKASVKVTQKTIMKKRESMVESSLSFDIEVLLPPLKEASYIVLEGCTLIPL